MAVYSCSCKWHYFILFGWVISHGPKGYTHPKIHCTAVYNSQHIEAIEMSTDRLIDTNQYHFQQFVSTFVNVASFILSTQANNFKFLKSFFLCVAVGEVTWFFFFHSSYPFGHQVLLIVFPWIVFVLPACPGLKPPSLGDPPLLLSHPWILFSSQNRSSFQMVVSSQILSSAHFLPSFFLFISIDWAPQITNTVSKTFLSHIITHSLARSE